MLGQYNRPQHKTDYTVSAFNSIVFITLALGNRKIKCINLI